MKLVLTPEETSNAAGRAVSTPEVAVSTPEVVFPTPELHSNAKPNAGVILGTFGIETDFSMPDL